MQAHTDDAWVVLYVQRWLQAPLALPGDDLLIEWGGAQRWLIPRVPGTVVRDAAHAAGGHAQPW